MTNVLIGVGFGAAVGFGVSFVIMRKYAERKVDEYKSKLYSSMDDIYDSWRNSRK